MGRDHAGTNAPGTTLALDHEVQVFAAEHYRHTVQAWTFSAAPIHDPATGAILGVVDVTGRDAVAHPHSLALVVGSAARPPSRMIGSLTGTTARVTCGRSVTSIPVRAARLVGLGRSPRQHLGMPIVVVTALPADELDVDRLLERVVRAVAEGVRCPVDGVWASFVVASAQRVGHRRAQRTNQCPIVIIRGRVRSDKQVAEGLASAARAVSAELNVPVEDVWVQWVDVAPGMVFAGGGVVT